jgi:3-dehydroquinate dehydratase-2
MGNVLLIHGPNLHLLGIREEEHYGRETLKDIDRAIQRVAGELGLSLKLFQFNSEGEIIDCITKEKDWADVLIVNPGAYTHTSIAIMDCVKACKIPTIEVHLSNIYKREDFRRVSYISREAVGVISGFGKTSYLLALHAASFILKEKEKV